MEENSIRWIGYEYEHTDKTADWFWAVGIISLCIAIISIIYDNTLFAIFIVIAGLMAITLAKRPPEIVEYALTPKGIMIDGKIYLYKSIHSFWIDTHIKEHPELLLKTRKNLTRLLVIPIAHGAGDPHKIRDYLLQALPEEHIEEPLSHVIMRKFGF